MNSRLPLDVEVAELRGSFRIWFKRQPLGRGLRTLACPNGASVDPERKILAGPKQSDEMPRFEGAERGLAGRLIYRGETLLLPSGWPAIRTLPRSAELENTSTLSTK